MYYRENSLGENKYSKELSVNAAMASDGMRQTSCAGKLDCLLKSGNRMISGRSQHCQRG